MSVRITCINKDGGNHQNPHEGITDYGWINESTNKTGKSTRSQMVSFIEDNNGKAYVEDAAGNKVYCYVRSINNVKFLQTYSNDKPTDNLLTLKECQI